jgi:hypothetical protein
LRVEALLVACQPSAAGVAATWSAGRVGCVAMCLGMPPPWMKNLYTAKHLAVSEKVKGA